MTERNKLVLASASPRRRDLLTQLGVSFEIDSADIDETPISGEAPADYVMRLATSKAHCVAQRHPRSGCCVLAADTTVVIDDTILGKPADLADGRRILEALSDRTHCVITAICLNFGDSVSSALVETKVDFISLEAGVIDAYLGTDEPWDKAGAYGIQGLGGVFVSSLHGSYSNVVGLPMAQTWRLLSKHGIANTLEQFDE